MTADIRIGDVWKSAKGDRLVTTCEVSRDGVWFRGAAAPDMCATPANFMRGRTLWERNGLRVGDVRAMGKASTAKILVLRDDVAVCDADGIRTYPAAEIAALPLVSRKD